MGQQAKQKTKPARWALGGEIVATVDDVKRVQRQAIKEGALYRLEQCRSVIAKIRAAQGAAA